MFLTKDNKIKWKWLGWGVVSTAILVFMGIAWFDKPLYLFLRNFDCWLFRSFGAVFSAEMWITVSAIVLVVFYIKKAINSKPRFRDNKNSVSISVFFKDCWGKVRNSYAIFVLTSVVGASLIGWVLKVFIGRARPVFYEALGMTGFFPPSFDWAFNSMPSGHTVASFAGLVMLGLLAPRVKWFTWTLAIFIGLSRVCVGAHWLTDVILGAFIGMVVADFTKAALKHHGADVLN